MEKFESNEILVQKLSEISPELAESIKEFNDAFIFKNEGRDDYTNPQWFLELVKYFQELTSKKDIDKINQIQSLEKGLAVVSNAYESLLGFKKEIEVKSVTVEEEKKNIIEVLANLEIEKKKKSEEKAFAEKALNPLIEANEPSSKITKEKEEAEAAKIAALNYAENIRKDELENFKNTNKPSRNHYLIFKLMYLIFNPEDKIPGDNIVKELPNIKKKCLDIRAEQIKQKLISRLNDISWITPEFLEKVKMYREEPFIDLKKMETISRPCKIIIGYFQNLVKYKRLYDIAESLMKKSHQTAQTASASMQKKEELEKKLELVSGTLRKIEQEFNESKEKLDKVKEEQNTLLKELKIAEKFIEVLASINEQWKKEVQKLKSDQ